MYKCPNCGGEMVFSPEKQKLVCQFCNSEFEPDQFDDRKGVRAEEYTPQENPSGEPARQDRNTTNDFSSMHGTVFTCPQCGAELFSTEETAATFCSFCGSSVLLESRISRERTPDRIIPFSVSKEKCEEIYKAKIRKSWFVPASMKNQETLEKFRGIYMPFWSYEITGEINGEEIKGTKSTRDGNYDIIDSYKLDVKGTAHYDGILYDASSTFPDDVSDCILPYSVKNKSTEFQPAYLTGFYADTADIPDSIYEEDAQNYAHQALEEKATENLKPYSATATGNTDIELHKQKTKFLFLPVWFLSSRNEKTGRVSYAVVNGETGKIHADLPIDFRKYLLLSLLIAVPFFLIYFLFTILPRTLVWIVFALLFIMLVLVNFSHKQAYIRDHALLDKGRNYKNPEDALRTGSVKALSSEKAAKKEKKKNNLTMGICFVLSAALAVFIWIATGIEFLGIAAFFVILFSLVFLENKIENKFLNDFSTTGYSVKIPWTVTLRVLVKPILGILVCLIISIWSPAADSWYYGAVIISSILLCLTVLDLVKYHNLLATRKPMQLGKRGGDENA